MSPSGPFLRKGTTGYAHWCPACEEAHIITTVPGRGALWTFNGDLVRPTFGPSVRVSSGHHVPGWKGPTCWCNSKDPDGEDWGFKCGVCHYFLQDGLIRYCEDSTHHLAGKVVALQPIPADYGT